MSESKIILRHVGIFVRDIEVMREFYSGCLGLKEKMYAVEGGPYLETFLGIKGIKLENYKLKDPNGMIIELLKTEERYSDNHAKQLCEEGCIHVALTVSDVDEVSEMVKKNGGEIISQPLVSPDRKAKVCFVRDPEGNYLELVEEL